MNINVKILSILNISKELGKNKIQIQNLDHLLGRKGEREYIGSRLVRKLEEMIEEKLVEKNDTFYSITKKGLEYLVFNSDTE